jgi:hypothetical protein
MKRGGEASEPQPAEPVSPQRFARQAPPEKGETSLGWSDLPAPERRRMLELSFDEAIAMLESGNESGASRAADALTALRFELARGDFNGDDLIDVAIGSPETNSGKGAVYIVEGAGGTTTWTEDTTGILGVAGSDDNFGASLAVGDFNNDGYDDLAIGTPAADDSGSTDSGAVHVLYGSSSGLTDAGDQLWHQDVSGIEGVAEASDYMGDALTVGDFNCDGYDDLAIGVPREDIVITSSITDAGAVNVIFGSSAGLSTVDSIWEQGSGGVDGTAEDNDNFGAALAAGNFNGDSSSSIECDDLAIGAPNEDPATSTSSTEPLAGSTPPAIKASIKTYPALRTPPRPTISSASGCKSWTSTATRMPICGSPFLAMDVRRPPAGVGTSSRAAPGVCHSPRIPSTAISSRVPSTARNISARRAQPTCTPRAALM